MRDGAKYVATLWAVGFAEENKKHRHHESAGEENAECDQDAELHETAAAAAQQAQESHGGGKGSKGDAARLAAQGGGDGGFVVEAMLAFHLLNAKEQHAEIDAQADEDRTYADGNHIQLVNRQCTGRDRADATKQQSVENGKKRAPAAEADPKH